MTTTTPPQADRLAHLPVRADEDPFTVAVGGFYRRWFSLLDDIDLLVETVATLSDTVDEDWVPVWSGVAQRHVEQAEQALAAGDEATARQMFLQAKSYYSIGRFPSPYHGGTPFSPAEMGPLKSECYDNYLECFRRASALTDTRRETMTIEHERALRGRVLLPPAGRLDGRAGARRTGDVRSRHVQGGPGALRARCAQGGPRGAGRRRPGDRADHVSARARVDRRLAERVGPAGLPAGGAGGPVSAPSG